MKPESCHDANFVVTGDTGVCRHGIPGVANNDKVGIMTGFNLQATESNLHFNMYELNERLV